MPSGEPIWLTQLLKGWNLAVWYPIVVVQQALLRYIKHYSVQREIMPWRSSPWCQAHCH